MKIYILLIAVLLSLCGMANAAELTNPGSLGPGGTYAINASDTLRLQSGESLNVDCDFDNYGTIEVMNGSTLFSTGNINNYGTIVSYGNIMNNCRIHNYGTIENHNTMYTHAWIYNEASGTINNHDTGFLFYLGYVAHNSGLINNDGSIELVGEVENTGTINNYGLFTCLYPIKNTGDIYNFEGNMDASVTGNDIINVPSGSQEIPEFPTIALPMIAILGLALFFKRR